MKNHSAIVLLFYIFLYFVTALCSTISVSFRHVNPCDDRKSHSKTLATCKYDTDCVENAYCWNRETCLCKDGFLVNKNRTHLQCLKVASKMGDSCIEDVQCRVTFTTRAECRNNICACSEGSHYEFEPKRCYESVGIGKMCTNSYNCQVEGSPSFCVDGFCGCPFQHHPNEQGTRCLKSSYLGDTCLIDEECIDMNSRCFGTCGCKIDYVQSIDGKRCLKAAASMGDPCIEDTQCTAFLKNSKCGNENKCTCLINLQPRGPLCLRKLNPEMLGKKCYVKTQCVKPTSPEIELKDIEVANVDCLNGICSCSQDYTLTEKGDDCIRYSENHGLRPSSNVLNLTTIALLWLIYLT
ncbi:prion-like-(Q/N-rich) domain-bearing protein 25 isoform X1 [Aphidius gifuensis]|uniref:prion-like-(Q/N-rich) domain-bearing protein 25 isoform X1 n=1 Tax=Aphidius gifuensis TaxID=684658 RepID=UPI001CDBDA7B|nr:prion-like-(Q/N-rich) domain-bearing protein 25 isoform X1 [Aphidius gifuensis]